MFICSYELNFIEGGGVGGYLWLMLLCLPVVTTDLEEAECSASIWLYVQHELVSQAEPGNSTPLPVLTLCRLARLLRHGWYIRQRVGGGRFCVCVLAQ